MLGTQLTRSPLRTSGQSESRLVAAAAALFLTGLVALGSRSGLGAGDLSSSYSRFVLLAAAAVVLALAAVGLWLDGYATLAGRRRRAKLIAAIVTLLLLTSLTSSLFRPDRNFAGYPCAPNCTKGGGHPSGGGKAFHGSGGGAAGFSFAGALAGGSLLAALLLGGVGLLLAARRQSVAVEAEPQLRGVDEALLEPLAEAVGGSLQDLRREGDVRRAVIACYARMERALARSGAVREPHEAPFEFLARVLEQIASEPGRVLTELFERAKFSLEPMGVPEKEDAIAALDQLRSAAAVPVAESAGA